MQWLKIHLPVQGTWVRALVQEDPTCRGATKPCSTTTEPALQSPRATTTEPTCHNYPSPRAQSPCSTMREATTVRSWHTATKSSSRSLQLEKARAQQRRPSAAKNKINTINTFLKNYVFVITPHQHYGVMKHVNPYCIHLKWVLMITMCQLLEMQQRIRTLASWSL